MEQIISFTFSIVFLLYFIGFGVTSLFLPKHLRRDMFWFMPWTGVALIALYGVILSFAKVPMSLAAYIIMGVSGVSALYALIMKRVERIHFFETVLLALGVLICFILNMIPLFKAGYPTVVSLGNVDPISYTNVADFFVNNTVWKGKEILPYTPSIWAVGDLVHYSYRWGSAMLLSFFNEILNVRSYQTFSIMISLLFAMSFPLLFVFAKQLTNRHHATIGFLLFLTFVLNSTLTYMLYHVFFAQFIFTGLYLYILILLFTKRNDEQKEISLLSFSGREILLGLILSAVTTLYPEGLVFILIPFVLVTAISYLLNRDIYTVLFFIKVCGLMIIVNPVTFYTAVAQNMKIIFSTSQNTFIGWESIRHASPLEMLGFYNLYYYRPLPLVIRLAIAFGFMGVWFIGFIFSKHKIWLATLVTMFFALFLHFVFNTPNFFLYHRTITYSIFLFSVLFSIGTAAVLSRFTKTYAVLALILLLAVTTRSFRRSFFQFYHHHAIVDRSLISLQVLANEKSVPKPFYTSDVFLGEYNLWRRLWQEYFLSNTQIISNQNYPTEKFEKRLPPQVYVLAEKNKLSQGNKSIKFSRKIWENEYYVLGEVVKQTDAKNKLLQ